MKETVNSKQSLDTVKSLIDQMQAEYGYLEITITPRKKTRTGSQRAALEVYCKEMAEKLNNAGITYRDFILYLRDRGVETEWNQERFKDAFRLYAGVMYPEILKDGVAKTSKLNTEQISKVYELVNLRMSEIYGCGMQWPSKD